MKGRLSNLWVDFQQLQYKVDGMIVLHMKTHEHVGMRGKHEGGEATNAQARYKPLSQGEEDRCRQEGLCFYCGSSKYKLPECPIKPNGLKARSAISMENGTLENRDV